MNHKRFRVLLIEDNPGDRRLIKELIAEKEANAVELAFAEQLSTGLEQIDRGEIDLVLLDLSLPDSHGLDTFVKGQQHAPHIPIVVLSGQSDEEFAIQAVQNGAQDYLVKGQVDGNLLVRAIRYAIERHRLQMELERARQREQQERELRTLERISGSTQAAITTQALGVTPLRTSLPAAFAQLVQRYSAVMDRALEQQAFRVEHHTSEELQFMAEQLGHRLNAGPRDVVDIHSTALKEKVRNSVPKKAQAYVEEGRFMVLELMGYLASFYRKYSVSSRRSIRPGTGEGKKMEHEENE